MTFRPKDKGTRAETALCDYLHDELGVEVMRRTMQGGGNDRGDLRIVGVPLMVEVKNTKRFMLDRWGVEVARQCANLGVPHGVLIWSPPGLGPKSIGRWVAAEWADTSLTPLGRSGALFTGPITTLATAIAGWCDKGPLFIQSEGVLRVRFRHLSGWVGDVQEHIAATFPTSARIEGVEPR